MPGRSVANDCEVPAGTIGCMIPTRARREDTTRRSSARHLRLRAATVALTLASAVLGMTTIAVAETPPSRPTFQNLSFTPVALPPGPSAGPVAPVRTPDPGAAVIDLFGRHQAPALDAARPEVDTPAAKAGSVTRTRIRARGDASWYCLPGVSACHRDRSGGMYAAAGPELRIGDWRGRTVSVCRGDDCISVQLIDWCACPGDRVIDLYGDAFRKLASLSAGIVPVTVRW